MALTATRLHSWRHPAVLAVAAVSMATGYAQFGATAALADVATAFGEAFDGGSIAAQAGMSGTVIGVGLAVIRGASLASLPLAGLADRIGRRMVVLACAAAGLAVTAMAALSPSYWWFVAIFALGRPMLSAANALAGVVAAEETRSRDRTKAIGLVAAAYAIGAGLTALLRTELAGDLGFRGLFGLAVVPLVGLLLLGRGLHETDRFALLDARRRRAGPQRPHLGAIPVPYRSRLVVAAVLAVAFTVMTGPANTFLFFYGEGILGISAGAMFLGVLGAGVIGLGGLLLGRWAADTLGRKVTSTAAHVLVAGAFVLAYSGTPAGLFSGYLLGAAGQGAYGVSFGALSAEIFPTSARATAAGWLTVATVVGAVIGLAAFGVLADALGGSFPAAAAALAVPMAVVVILFSRLPETRGIELEVSAPETA